MRSSKLGLSRLVGFVLVGALGLHAKPTFANGRYPAADELVFDTNDPNHMVVRATYGFLETFDGGATWQWVCEQAVGRIGDKDPPLAIMADGTVVVAVAFEGVLTTRDKGCTWTKAPAPLMGQLVQDIVLEPSDAASLLAVTSTGAGDGSFSNVVAETKDNGSTWAALGAELASDFVVLTIEIAPSDPNRLYVSGVLPSGSDALTVIERSEDRGKTWTRETSPLPSPLAGFFISAVDPQNPDVLYGRLASNASDTTGNPPTTLRVSHDKGATWQDLYSTTSSMLGFALSPDGTQIALGAPMDGIFVGPADGSGFTKVASAQNRCLRWTGAGLYTCGKEPFDDFAIGLSSDGGKSYAPVYKRAQTCPATCADSTPFGMLCPSAWTNPNMGIAQTIGVDGSMCSVPWAKVDLGLGGAGGGTAGSGGSGASGSAGSGGASGGGSESSSSCAMGAGRGASSAVAGAALALAIAAARRRKRKQGRGV